jgi:DNA-directed RNA polymerase III subunit RPC11
MTRVCPTCPYKWVIAQRISMRTHLKRKEVDDVLGGKDSWANVDVVDGESCSARAGHVPFIPSQEWVERKRVSVA